MFSGIRSYPMSEATCMINIINIITNPTTIHNIRRKYPTIDIQTKLIYDVPADQITITHRDYIRTPNKLSWGIDAQQHWDKVETMINKMVGLWVSIHPVEQDTTTNDDCKIRLIIHLQYLYNIKPEFPELLNLIDKNHHLYRVKQVILRIEGLLISAPDLVAEIRRRLILEGGVRNPFGLLYNKYWKQYKAIFEHFLTISLRDVFSALGQHLGILCGYYDGSDPCEALTFMVAR